MRKSSVRFLLSVSCAAILLCSRVALAADSSAEPPSRDHPPSNPIVDVGPITVRASRLPGEEALVGPNQQPEWTTRRRFAETRIYVLPPWELALYTTWRIQKSREEEDEEEGELEPGADKSFSNLLAQEFELGLPYRFQIEYQATGSSDSGDWRFDDQSLELRWAPGDWGRVPLNPTLFGEWKFRNGEADSFETKLLLGDEIASRWHYGINLFFEQQVGEGREQEIAATFAVSYSVIDVVLGVGVESEFGTEREQAEEDSEFEFRGLIGPSIQSQPFGNFFVDFVPLFGLSEASPVFQSFLVLGYNFNAPTESQGTEPPVSIRSR